MLTCASPRYWQSLARDALDELVEIERLVEFLQVLVQQVGFAAFAPARPAPGESSAL